MNRFPHQAPLPVPEMIATPEYTALYNDFKTEFLKELTNIAPDDAAVVAQTIENNAELLTKAVQVFTLILQNHYRRWNDKAQQMFGMYAKDDAMIDVIASEMGLTRQVVEKGDPDAFPPVPPTMESNEQLLTRYYLSMFALATTGTREGYRFHAMTLGGMPNVDVQSPNENTVVVTYNFDEHEQAGQIKDAEFRQAAPNTGKVNGYLLAHSGDGVPSQKLIEATKEYMTSHPIAQETDQLFLHPASVNRWQLEAVVHIHSSPDKAIVKKAVEQAAWEYGKQQHKLQGKIERSMLDHKLLSATNGSGLRVTVISPADNISCDHTGAPYLESVNIRVEYE